MNIGFLSRLKKIVFSTVILVFAAFCSFSKTTTTRDDNDLSSTWNEGEEVNFNGYTYTVRPTITSSTYDASTGVLQVTGTDFPWMIGFNNDIVVNKLTFTGEGGETYTLTNTLSVDITNSTSFTLTLSTTDREALGRILNKNGSSSTTGTTYNLAAAEGWLAGAETSIQTEDLTGNPITVSNVPIPTITSATYDVVSGTLTVTGTGFLSKAGSNNDIVANKLRITGGNGAEYNLSDTQNTDITSSTSFSLILSAFNKRAVNILLNKNGTSSIQYVIYNLGAAQGWAAGADAAVVTADLTGNPITVININTAPTGISLSSASVNQSAGLNAVVGSLSTTDADLGDTFTYTLVAGVGSEDNVSFNISGSDLRLNNASLAHAGQYSVRVRSTDQAGAFFEKSFNITVVDDVSPTLAISSSRAKLILGQTAAITFVLSEPSSDFDATDITVSGGSISNFSGSGRNYTAIFTPNNNATVTGAIAVSANKFTDLAGNMNAVGNNLNIIIDTERPTITISSDKTSLIAGETATLTFTLSEVSSGFSLVDIEMNNGATISNLSVSDMVYTAIFTPVPNSVYSIDIWVPENSITDVAGNANLISNQLTLSIDTKPPTVTITSDKNRLKADETATVTFVLSESSTNFEETDIIVSGGSLSNFSGQGTTYSALFTPSTNSTLPATFNINAGVFTDAAGNANLASSPLSVLVDTQAPSGYSVTINQASITLANQTAFSFTLNGAELGTVAHHKLSSSGGAVNTGSFYVYNSAMLSSDVDVTNLSNGTLTLEVYLVDSFGNVGETVTATVEKAVNYPPVITTSAGATTFIESILGDPVPVVIDTALSITDTDNATLASATVSITGNFYAGEDVLSFVNDASTMGNIVGAYNPATGVLVLGSESSSATKAQWQAALRAVTYSNTSLAPHTSNRTLSFVVNDGLDNSNVATKQVSVQAVNNAPVLTNLDGDVITFTEDGPAVWIDQGGNVTVRDPDSPDLDGGALIVALIANKVASEDVLGIHNEGMVAGQIGVVDSDVYYGGTHFGLLTGGTGGVDLNVSFLPTATPAAVQALIRNLTYKNTNTTNPSVLSRTIRITLSDGDGATSLPSLVTVHVVAVNDPPVITVGSSNTTFTESLNGAPVPVEIDSGLRVSDPDHTTLASANIRIASNFVASEDVLGFTNDGSTMGNISGSYNASTGRLSLLSLESSATLAQWEAALRAVTYHNTSQNPSTATRTVLITVHDGTNASSASFKNITVVAVNSAPVAVDDRFSGDEDSQVTGNVLTNDSDPEGDDLSSSVLVGPHHGTISLNANGSFTYTPDPDFYGLDSLQYQVADVGVPLRSSTAWLYITVNPVNDAPTITLPSGLQEVHQGTVLTFSVANANSIQVDDVDAIAGLLKIKVTTQGGSVGKPGSMVPSGDSKEFTLNLADMNAFLEGIVFTPDANFRGRASILIEVNDQGNTGSGGALSAVKTLNIEVIDSTPPAIPTGLTARAGDGQVDLTWNAPTDLDLAAYTLYWGTNGVVTNVETIPAGTAFFTHAGLANGTTYSYQITALDDLGNESAVSELVTAKPMGLQSLTFGPLTHALYKDAPRTLNALASSGLPVTYTSSDPSIASIVNNTVVIHQTGTVVITASQAGNDAYLPAASVSQSLTIEPAVISGLTLTSVSFVYNGSNKALSITGTLPEGTQVEYTHNVRRDVGTQVVTATIRGRNYITLTLEAVLTITPATRSIDFRTLPSKTYGDADFVLGAQASTGEAILYSSSHPNVATVDAQGVVRVVGAGTTTITATVPANANYNTIPVVQQELRVAKAKQILTIHAPAEVKRDAGTVQIQAISSSGLPVTLTINDPQVATLDGNNLHILRLGTLQIKGNQEGNANYESASEVTTTLRVTETTLGQITGIRVHQAFSPNGDGINDFLMIEGVRDYPENRIKLFSRNGNLIYEASGYNNGSIAFKGRGSKNQKIPAGTYYYVLEVKQDGKWKMEKGFFVLRY